ncbi:BREX-2 system adenine-specific DNA-methyltransferase PglX [Polaromonas sp.]|uniref:BREX-2 system adenine-specific DNA-methyltransferase PglX n=1 Tax=Polaromonas sp. TaxID=1869339 RepID=UPI003BB5E36B
MINAPQLLADLKRRLTVLESDLRERIQTLPDLKASLQAEWQAARDAKRTAETLESWSDQVITQAGVHWLLSCVFLRFIEDNALVERPWLSGTPGSGRLALARDWHETYFRASPLESDRDYLLACFTEAGTLPGLHTFFDAAHNPVFRLGISGDAAMSLRQFWQQQDPNTGALLHDFTDASWNTRFLGDLYQDLSEATRKRYALLQTPEFVEEFILDRTLSPAIREFGYRKVRMIDPTCGSGHFLLGGFQRMVDEWSRAEPTRNRRDVAQKALDAVAGVDLNPFAVAISRFRLLLAALQASDVQRLSEAPDFTIHVAIGDSLLHGQRFGLSGQSGIQSDELFDVGESHADSGLAHAYASEDLSQVQRILGRQYHAVVGNPPYIVVKDAALNAAYRKQYASCHMKYSLGAPFTERFFELAVTGRASSLPLPLGEGGGEGGPRAAGFVGLITANSFMKREFGAKLIEQVLPRLDLTHVVDTSGAYIPGHGTPTVILFGRHRLPQEQDNPIRTVMGIKGEPSTPDNPAHGLVWSAILDQIDRVDSESDFVSVADTSRMVFGRHPWTIGGGGATDLKEVIETDLSPLNRISASVGITCFTLENEVFLNPLKVFARKNVESSVLRGLVSGDELRDWSHSGSESALFPYSQEFGPLPLEQIPRSHCFMWPFRTGMASSKMFGKQTKVEAGLKWWEYGRLTGHKLKTPLSIPFAFVSTHNHFVLDRGGKVFIQSAPLIKLPANASLDEHLELLGLLNSSVACFWMKQVMHDKGNGGIGGGIASEDWERFYEFTSTALQEFPLPVGRPLDIATRLDTQASQLAASQPAALIASNSIAACAGTASATGQKDPEMALPTRASLDAARARAAQLRRQMIAGQEELDWRCYRLYGLLPAKSQITDFEHAAPPEVALGERAFEIVLARRLAAGTETTTWFERHGSTPVTEIPGHWPEDYRQVVRRRIDLIASDRNIALIERPEYKRRWNSPKWNDLEQAALRDWLLARLELPRYWPASAEQPPQLTSTSRLADAARMDADFMQMAALYAGHADFDPGQLVAQLVASEAAPFLPVLRYTEAGLRKRAQWEATWALQRREDAGEDLTASVGKIPVPPKYKSTDFLKTDVWRLRGGLDVPKERWVSYPGCERGADGSLIIAWAGWDHLQQATALAGFYLDMKDSEGWPPERLQPLLAGLLELVPWLAQWHNEVDPVYGERMGDYYQGFVAEEARAQGFSLDDLRDWKPTATVKTLGRRKATAASE